jgi:hypothetical protein
MEFSPASLKPNGASTLLYFSTKSVGRLKEKKSDIKLLPFESGIEIYYSIVFLKIQNAP